MNVGLTSQTLESVLGAPRGHALGMAGPGDMECKCLVAPFPEGLPALIQPSLISTSPFRTMASKNKT